jgi:hypothetical protein
MTQAYEVDGDDLAAHVVRSSVSFTEVADHGRVGEGKFDYTDHPGSLETFGHKEMLASQSDCTVTRSFTGYVGPREISPLEDQPYGPARLISFTTLDLNARLAFRQLKGRGWRRRKESLTARLTDLLDDDTLAGLVSDFGLVDFPDITLDKNDYRTQYPTDVLRDMALEAKFNFFPYWDAAEADVGLWFQDSNTADEWVSTLKISNVAGDSNAATIFAPLADAPGKLTRDPSRTYSRGSLPFKRGYVWRERPATEDTYERRDISAPNAQVKTRAKARSLLDTFLEERRNEENRIPFRIRVPAAKSNLLLAGQLVEVRLRHTVPEGYADWSWFRMLERTLTQPMNDDNIYEIAGILTPAEGFVTPLCGIYSRTPNGAFWPLGGNNTTSQANVSDGISFYWRGGQAVPNYPPPYAGGAGGYWHFPEYQAGGPGTIDYAGDNSGNVHYMLFIGDGTLLYQSEMYGSPRTLDIYKGTGAGGGSIATTLVGSITTGDSIEVSFDTSDGSDTSCINWVKVTQTGGGGGKWGWSQGTWERA